MIIRLLIILVFVVFSPIMGYSQEEIVWKQDKKITWDMFIGQPINNYASAQAEIRFVKKPKAQQEWNSVSMNYTIKYNLHIKAVLIPSQSWVKFKSDVLLEHEQIHFDIAELYVRQMNKRITEIESINYEVFTHLVDSIYNISIQQCEIEQNNFDSISNSSRNRYSQVMYKNKLEKELESLIDFHNITIELKFLR